MNNQKIICGKYDNNIYIDSNFILKAKNRVRIGSINPNNLKDLDYIPIATNGNFVIYDNLLLNTRDFFANFQKQDLNRLIVLTYKERQLILEELVDFDFDIKVFEVLYPFFKYIKYVSNINMNYKELNKLLQIVRELEIKGKSLPHYLSTKYLYKIERKLRFKNQLDYFFAYAYKGGYQEVFKLKEERLDRAIIAFDFNSMYIDSMMGNFMEPKSIRYINLVGTQANVDDLSNGLYRVILKNAKDTFFKKYHPFKYIKSFQSFYFQIEYNQEIELLLFKNEIIYYKKFFEKIEIIDGFSSSVNVSHPLKEDAINIYNERLKHKSNGNSILNDFSKYKLITMHSATNPKNFKFKFFTSKENMIKYLSYKYMLNFPKYMNSDEKLYLMSKSNKFTFTQYKNGYKVKLIDHENNKSVYSLSAQILATARIKMMRTIENFLQYDSVEICYANTDSIHISIKKDSVNDFILDHKYMISDKIGDLKIETISEKGYWFDVGRYWLISNNKVDLYKNVFFNQNTNLKEFLYNRKVKLIYQDKKFKYIKTFYLNIYKFFTYSKKIIHDKDEIDKIDLTRYNYEEIKSLDVANFSYNKEVLTSGKLKVDLFKRIATVQGRLRR